MIDSDKGLARSMVYRLFSACFYCPEKEINDILVNLSNWIEKEFPEFSPNANDLLNIFNQTDIETHQVEYTRLFLGPMNIQALPYASSYLEEDGYLMGNVSNWVADKYKELGMSVEVPEAPDHVAIELEFLHFLVANNHFTEEKLFLKHINSWYPQFQQRIQTSGIGQFYPALSSFLTNFLHKVSY